MLPGMSHSLSAGSSSASVRLRAQCVLPDLPVLVLVRVLVHVIELAGGPQLLDR